MAVSVLGRIGIQAGCTAAGPSSRTGLMLTTSTPAAASARNESAVECEAQPPFATCVFFGFAPPNITRSRECRAIDDHDVNGPVTAWAEPITCGRKVSAVPKL